MSPSSPHMARVFDGSDFETDLAGVVRHRLAPGERVTPTVPTSADAVHAVLVGSLRVDSRSGGCEVQAPAVIQTPLGALDPRFESIGGPAELVTIWATSRAQAIASPTMRVDRLDRTELSDFEAHGGVRAIRFRTVFVADDFVSAWNSVDHLVVPSGTTVGYHRNDGVEEVLVVLRGAGRMRIDGLVADVGAGDCIANRLGGSHGLANPFEDPLELLNVSVRAQNGLPDAVDLGDDLSDLL